MMPAASPAQSRITLSGFTFDTPGTWQRKTGGNVSGEPRRWREGGELSKEEVAGGTSTRENFTVSRNFRPDRDLSLLRAAQRHANRAYGVLSEQHLDDTGSPYGDPVVHNVLLVACNDPEANADDTSGFKVIELTLAATGESA
jgi:hypothetical protein